jgi:hypothetical protein
VRFRSENVEPRFERPHRRLTVEIGIAKKRLSG